MPRVLRSSSTVAKHLRALVVLLASMFAVVSGPSFAQRYVAGDAHADGSVRAPTHASKTAEAHAVPAVRGGHAEPPRASRGDGAPPALAVPNEVGIRVARSFATAPPQRHHGYESHVPAKTHAELMVFLN